MASTPFPSSAPSIGLNSAPASQPNPIAAEYSRESRPILECRTLQNYGKTLAWTFAAVALCGLGYIIEKYFVLRGGSLRGIGIPIEWPPLKSLGDDAPYRLFKNPAELPMRLFGIPHILIGTLFLLSSKRIKGARSFAWLGGLLAISIAFCVLFHWSGAHLNPLALLLFYFYFLIHGFRDEAFFYKAFGDMPKEAGKTHERLMIVLQLLFLGILASLIIPGYVLYAEYKPEFRHPVLEAMFPASWSYVMRFAVMIIPMSGAAVFALWRIGRSFPDGLAGLWRAHQPILTIFLMSTAIILLPLATGPWTFNVVVLMHFVGWYLFGRYRLATAAGGGPQIAKVASGTVAPIAANTQPSAAAVALNSGPSSASGAVFAQPSRPPSLAPAAVWKWMRTTRVGFTWLHLGLAAIVVLLAAVSTYAFGKSDWIEIVMGSKAFFYWTIIHVTLSFFPR